ncbi:MAG: response regulator [Lachnospiraceae bacterium]|nr:response regulator [Lachnospiraceae bacterium]
MILKNEEFSFREFLDQINIIINGQCQDKGLNYDCIIVGEISDYYIGDDMKLKQVIINILGNSVKFTETPGSVKLMVEQTAQTDDMCTLRFIMEDTGIGMEKEFIPKIFESFSQEDVTTTNRYGGSGLGMAITRNFVEMMNGEIRVESEKGVGSVFTVTVKLARSDRSTADNRGIGLPEGLGAVNEGSTEDILAGRRILTAEDVEQNAEILGDLLELKDIVSERAKNGAEAVKMFSESDEGYYDAILMDVRMPEMDGLTATQKIRGLERPDAKTIEKRRKVADTLLVHCYAGQSRSRAVGAFAVEMLGGDNSKYFEEGTPNQYIYDVLESAWVRKQLSRM